MQPANFHKMFSHFKARHAGREGKLQAALCVQENNKKLRADAAMDMHPLKGKQEIIPVAGLEESEYSLTNSQ